LERRNELTPADLARYQAVCLLNVARPDRDLWEILRRYLREGGGVAIIPGGAEVNVDSYQTDAAKSIMPAQLVKLVGSDSEAGSAWKELTYQHPVLAPFREWGMTENIDFIKFPPTAYRYWEVRPYPNDSYVIVSYADKQNRPALIERLFERTEFRGRLLLYTTPLDDSRYFSAERDKWNTYTQGTSFYLVLANKTVGYLTGDAEQPGLNYLSGQTVTVPLPLTSRAPSYTLQGPGISGTDAVVTRAENQSELNLPQAVTPGNFHLLSGDASRTASFSVNLPPDECLLARAGDEPIEAVLGKDAVLPLGHNRALSEALQGHWGQPVELFPWLMILVLIGLAVENLLANRFYRNEPPTEGERQAPGEAG
jgi:hypothetical protein